MDWQKAREKLAREKGKEARKEANRFALEKRIKLEKERRDLIERQQAVKRERKIHEMEAKTKKLEAQARLEETKRRLEKAKPHRLAKVANVAKRVVLGPSRKRKHRSSSAW